MKMRKEMGGGKKKEKNIAEGSKAFIGKYFIKKNDYIAMPTVGLRLT